MLIAAHQGLAANKAVSCIELARMRACALLRRLNACRISTRTDHWFDGAMSLQHTLRCR